MFDHIDLNTNGGKASLGKLLRRFEDRELGGIRLRIHDTDPRRPKISFERVSEGPAGPGPAAVAVAGVLFGESEVVPPIPVGVVGFVGVCNPVTTSGLSRLTSRLASDVPCCNGVLEGDKPDNPDIKPAVPSAPPPTAGPASVNHDGTPVATKAELVALMAELSTINSMIAVGAHPPGNDPHDPFAARGRLVIATPHRQPWLVNVEALAPDLLPLAVLLAEKGVIAHKADPLLYWLQSAYNVVVSRAWCIRTAFRLLTAGTRESYKLSACIARYPGMGLPPDPTRRESPARGVAILHELKARQEAELVEAGLKRVVAVEMELIPVVVDMEVQGVPFTRLMANPMLRNSQTEVESALADLRTHTPPEFNPNSTDQVKQVLAKLGFSVPKVDKETLQRCEHPFAAALLRHRKFSKRAAQLQSLLSAVGPDKRIHGRFDPMGTDTGRFSSSKPNLQNIDKYLRYCVIAPVGHVLILTDLSQIELRIAASITGDPRMLAALNARTDLHVQTASLILDIDQPDVTDEQRQLAKAVNFGLLYGQTAGGLVDYARKTFGVAMTPEQAEVFRRKFLEAYPKIADWHHSARGLTPETGGEIRTIMGRRRLLPANLSRWDRFAATVNTPVQGGAADGLKLAMIDIRSNLPAGAHMIATIHDEIIVLSPSDVAPIARQIVETSLCKGMEQLFPGTPFEVDSKVVNFWGGPDVNIHSPQVPNLVPPLPSTL